MLALVSAGGRGPLSAQTIDSSVVVQPRSAREAEALGLKLLGVYNRETGEWIDRATVRDTLGNETRTSRGGVATLNVLKPVLGTYLLEIRREGYLPRRVAIDETVGEEFLIDLDPVAPGSGNVLPAVVTTAKATIATDEGTHAGFFHRCEMGVSCLGRADLDRRPTEGVMDQLQRVPGTHRNCKPAFAAQAPLGVTNINRNSIDFRSALGDACAIEMQAAAPNGGAIYCTPTYFINGFEMVGAALPTVDHIEGMEIYPTGADAPVRFRQAPVNLGPTCGSIVIWTR